MPATDPTQATGTDPALDRQPRRDLADRMKRTRAFAGVVVLAAAFISAATLAGGSAGARSRTATPGTVALWTAATRPAGLPTNQRQYRFYEQQATFQSGPTSIEFTSLDFTGNHAHHSDRWSATDHFLCTVSGAGAVECDGQIALDSSMLLIHGPGGQGDFSVPVVAGTGAFAGARGTLHVHNLGTTENSDLTITLH